MAEVITTLDALIQMGRLPGLRAKVQERLLSVLEAALEIRKFPGGHVDSAAPLVVRVDDCEISYSLNLDDETVHVVAVSPVQNGRSIHL